MINKRELLTGFSGLIVASTFPKLVLAQTGEAEFDLTAGPAKGKLYRSDGPESDLWTYNGQVPGPEIRVQRGQRVRVRFTNNLEEPTSIHWHGIRIANAMDGVSGLTQEPIKPGSVFKYEFNVPDAGTYWYHAHNKSWNQVGRGLYGPLIIDEPSSPFDRDHDITLVIDDWRLRQPGVLDTDSFGSLMDWSHGGRLGNWIIVNGQQLPVFSLTKGEYYRLRLINASNARIVEIDPNRFSGKVIAYDGQPLPQPMALPYSPALLGPAQRMDLLVLPEENFLLEEISGDKPYPLASFRITDEQIDSGRSHSLSLPKNSISEPDVENARRIKIVMEGGAMGGPVEITYKDKKLQGDDYRAAKQFWAFNGVANLTDAPFFSARNGETIVIETVNRTGWVHAMHIHGHHFRVISRSGSEVDEGKPWRDTFLVGPEQTTEIAFVADNPGKWLYHCHMLEHAVAGMNAWFEVS